MQTSVTCYLDQEGVDYRLLPHSKPAKTIEEAAQERGVDPEQMVKSILLRDMSGFHVLACVPGPAQVDPRKVREMFGCRRMTCADASDVEKVTGLAIGTVAPVGLKRPLPVIFDHAIKKHHRVNISSGDPMAGLELGASDLINLSGAILAPIAIPNR